MEETYHIRCVLPSIYFSRRDAWCRDAPQKHIARECCRNIYVQTFLVTDSAGPGRKGTAASLQHVWNSHARGAVHQASLDGALRSEYTDEVAEKRRGDNGKVNRGDLQPNGGRRGRVF